MIFLSSPNDSLFDLFTFISSYKMRAKIRTVQNTKTVHCELFLDQQMDESCVLMDYTNLILNNKTSSIYANEMKK